MANNKDTCIFFDNYNCYDYLYNTTTNNYINSYNYIDFILLTITNIKFIITSLTKITYIFSSTFGLTMLFFGYFFYGSMKNDFIKYYNNNKNLYEVETFLYEFDEDFEDLSYNNLSNSDLENLKHKLIKYNTINGTIIMYYDNDNKYFGYYSKSSNNYTFNYLDAIAKLYTIKYNCKNIYIENQEITKDLKEKNIYKENNRNIFYSNVKPTTTEQTEQTEQTETKSQKKASLYVSNKFKYKGTLHNFIELCKKNNYIITINEELSNIININNVDKSNSNKFFYNIFGLDLLKLNIIDLNQTSNIIQTPNVIQSSNIKNNDFMINSLIDAISNNIYFKNILFTYSEDNTKDNKVKKENISFKDFISINKEENKQ